MIRPHSALRGYVLLLLGFLTARPFAFGASPSESPPPRIDPATVLRSVDAYYNHLSSLRCEFDEHFVGVGADRAEAGTLLLSRGGHMRWTYSKPPGKLFVLDGRYAWFYAPGSAQVQRVPAKQLDDLRSPLRFLLGHTKLERELDGIAVSAQPAGFGIRGVPKGMEQRISDLQLDVKPSGAIERIRVEERDGSVTEFHFQHLVENVAVPPDSFHFQVPEGVPVVNAMAPI